MDVALEAAEAADVVVVASVGNSSTTTEHWPTAHRFAVAVAAVNGTTRADYSNHGGWIDIAAPGCNPADKIGAGIRDFCGTSGHAATATGRARDRHTGRPALRATRADERAGDEVPGSVR